MSWHFSQALVEGILGGTLLGWKTVCTVELNAFCARRLMQRQNEGHLSPFPIWDDVRSFSGYQWCGLIDVVSGGFPCQDISIAGKRIGLDGEHSGLWKEMFRIIREVRPTYAFLENSPLLTRRGIDRVLWDLASLGFDAIWGVLGANDVGAPHIRKRIWILAYTSSEHGEREPKSGESKIPTFPHRNGKEKYLADSNRIHGDRSRFSTSTVSFKQTPGISKCQWWETKPEVDRVVDGMAHRLEQLRAIGNGQVPMVAKVAWNILSSK
ncbi:C-5 cytosine-specific DNA methylase domain protein [Leptospira interrogans str. L1207]|nr:C-5 cytosine-specific DNA methylase domain protein [Leptospira interrogans str. L1207]